MKNRTRQLVIAALLSIALATSAAADLSKRIDAILADPGNRKVHFAVRIVKADSGRTVYEHDARELMIPASNMKMITTAAALYYLGPEYEYVTKVGLCGEALVVIGSGDPLLGDPVIDAKYERKTGWIFKQIAETLRREGITTVRNIIVDTSVFDDERVHPNWLEKHLIHWYGAELSGLNYNDNCIDVIAKNSAGVVTVTTKPQTSFIRIISKAAPISDGDNAVWVERSDAANELILRGKCRDQATIVDIAIRRPPAFFGFLLAESLASAGIGTQGQFIEKALDYDCKFRLLVEFTTPIADVIERANKRSLGLAAEALIKTIAANSNLDKAGGSWKRGREMVGRYLSDLGIDSSHYYIDDGSGLSRVNELTAHVITTVLLDLYKGPNWHLYRDSLAVGGVDGTLQKHFYERKYKARIIGKTGYIDGVKSLSGICITKKGDYIFSILANSANGLTREGINNIAKAIIDDVEPDPPKKKPSKQVPEKQPESKTDPNKQPARKEPAKK